jgi:hypothetical protein
MYFSSLLLFLLLLLENYYLHNLLIIAFYKKGKFQTTKLYRNYLEKNLEYDKAYAALYFWIEYRADKNSDIESAASKTLKEIARRGIENGMQTLPWQTIEKILYYAAAAENKINVDKIRESKVIQAQLELIRREQEAGEKYS